MYNMQWSRHNMIRPGLIILVTSLFRSFGTCHNLEHVKATDLIWVNFCWANSSECTNTTNRLLNAQAAFNDNNIQIISYECRLRSATRACQRHVPKYEKYPVLMYGTKEGLKLFAKKSPSVRHLVRFTNKYLVHQCHVPTLSWCDPEQIALIKELRYADISVLRARIESLKREIETHERTHDDGMQEVRRQYEHLRQKNLRARRTENTTVAILRSVFYARAQKNRPGAQGRT